jgi:transcriptional regulator with XRE-family HTH domain
MVEESGEDRFMSKNGFPLPHLRAWREHAYLSQYQLADLAGITKATIQNIEVGRYGSASFYSIQALALALGISADKLVEEMPPRKVAVPV